MPDEQNVTSQPAVSPGAGPACPETDEEWMTAFAGGRTEGFKVLFSRYKQPLFGFFRRRIFDSASAEELTQETFLLLIRNARSYQPTALFRTYLYTLAFNLLRAYCRKAAFRATFLGIATSHHEPSTTSSVHDDLALRQAVGQLCSIDREVLMLREFEQLTYAEIAELLDLPLNTVRSRLFRARIALREVLSAVPSQPAPLLHPFKETL